MASTTSGQTATGAAPGTPPTSSQGRVSIHIGFHEASRARLATLPPLKGSKQPRDGTVSRNIPVAGSTQLAKVFRAFARDQELQDQEDWQMMFQPISSTNPGANRIITTLTIKVGQLNVKQNDRFALIHKTDAGGLPTFPPQRAPAAVNSQPPPPPAAAASVQSPIATSEPSKNRNDAQQVPELPPQASELVVPPAAQAQHDVARPAPPPPAAPAPSTEPVPSVVAPPQQGLSDISEAVTEGPPTAAVAQGALPTDTVDHQSHVEPKLPTEAPHRDPIQAAQGSATALSEPIKATTERESGDQTAPVVGTADSKNAATDPSETAARPASEAAPLVPASAQTVASSELPAEAVQEKDRAQAGATTDAITTETEKPSGAADNASLRGEAEAAQPRSSDVVPEQGVEIDTAPQDSQAAVTMSVDDIPQDAEPSTTELVDSSTNVRSDVQTQPGTNSKPPAAEEPPRQAGQSGDQPLQQTQPEETTSQPSVAADLPAPGALQGDLASPVTRTSISAVNGSSAAESSEPAQARSQDSDKMEVDDNSAQSKAIATPTNAIEDEGSASKSDALPAAEAPPATQSTTSVSTAHSQPPRAGLITVPPADDEIDRMFESVLQTDASTDATKTTWMQTLSNLGNAAPVKQPAKAAASPINGQIPGPNQGKSVNETESGSSAAEVPSAGREAMTPNTMTSPETLQSDTNLLKSTGGPASLDRSIGQDSAQSTLPARPLQSSTSSGASVFSNILQKFKAQRSAAAASEGVETHPQAEQPAAPQIPPAPKGTVSEQPTSQGPQPQVHLGADNFFADQMDLDAASNDSRNISVQSTPALMQDKALVAAASGPRTSGVRGGATDPVPRAGPASKTSGFKARPRSKGGEGATPRARDAAVLQSIGHPTHSLSSSSSGAATMSGQQSSASHMNPATVAPGMDVAAMIRVKKEHLAQNEEHDASLLAAVRNFAESRSTRYDDPSPPAGSQARLLHNPADLLPRRAPSRTVSPEPRVPEGTAHIKQYRNPRKYWEGEDELGRRSRSPIEPFRHPPEVRKQMTARERLLNDLIDGPIDRLPEEGPQARPRPRYTEDWSSGSGEDTDDGDSADEATLRKRAQILAEKGIGSVGRKRKRKKRAADGGPQDAVRRDSENGTSIRPAGSEHTANAGKLAGSIQTTSNKGKDLAKMDKEERAEARAAKEIEDIINHHELLKLRPAENKKARVGPRKALYDECPRIPKEFIDWREEYALMSVEELDEHICALLGGNLWRNENKIAERYHFNAIDSRAKLGRVIVLIEVCLFTRADLANELWRFGKGGGRKNIGVAPGDWPITLAHVVSKVMKPRKNTALTMRDLDDAIAEAVALKRREMLDGEVDEELQAKMAISSSQAIKVSPPKATTLQQPPTPPGGWPNMPKNRPISGQSSTPTPSAKATGPVARRSESAARSHSPATSNRSRAHGPKTQVSGGSSNHNAELKRKRSGIQNPQEDDEDSEQDSDSARPLARQRVTAHGSSTTTKKASSAKAKRTASPANGEGSRTSRPDSRRSGSISADAALMQEVDELVDEKLDNSFARRFEEQFSSAFGEAWRGAHALGFKEMFPKAAHDYWQSRHKEILASSRLQLRAEHRREFEALLREQEERLNATWERRLEERDTEWKERFDTQQQAFEAQLSSFVADQERKQLAREKSNRKILKEQMLMELGAEIRSQVRLTGTQNSSGQPSSSNEVMPEVSVPAAPADEQTHPAAQEQSEPEGPSKGPKSRKVKGPGPASKRKDAETAAMREAYGNGEENDTPSPRAQGFARARSSSSEQTTKPGSRFSHIEVLLRHKPLRDSVVQQSSDGEDNDEDDGERSDNEPDAAEKLNGEDSSDTARRRQDDSARLRSAANRIISTIGENPETFAAVSEAVERVFGSPAGGDESGEAAHQGAEDDIEQQLADVEDEEMNE